MKPLLKWPGGKRRELSKLMPFVPDTYDRYIEPFFGGGAMFFHLQPKKAILSDLYNPLIRFYKEVKFSFADVRKGLDIIQACWDANRERYMQAKSLSPDEFVENPNAILYYQIRAMFNMDVFRTRGLWKYTYEEYDPKIEQIPFGAGFWFLNHMAYAGMLRFNSEGEFNVPFGHYKTLDTSSVTQDYCELLQSAELLTRDFLPAFLDAKPDDFMFLDPPYDTKFSQYGFNSPFGEAEQERLAWNFRMLPCKALLVINRTPLTERLYSEYIKTSYSYTYNTNIKNRYSRQTEHLVICNF